MALFLVSIPVVASPSNLMSSRSLWAVDYHLWFLEDSVCEDVYIPTIEDSVGRLIGIDYKNYIDVLGEAESSNNYKAINTLGYMGRWQFGKSTLEGLGYSVKEIEGFVDDEQAQRDAMIKLTIHNYKIIKRYGLIKHVGKKINGTKASLEGMLAAAHLRGCYSVKKYILSNGKINEKDGYNTSVLDYIEKFSQQ